MPHRGNQARRPRVLYVCPAVPPVAAPESFAVLKKLRALSEYLDLTVLAADDPDGYFPLGVDSDLQALLPSQIRVVTVPVPGRSPWNRGLDLAGQLLFRHSAIADAYLARWARRALRLAAVEDWFRGFDGMITNSSPVISHYVGLGVRRHNPGLTWIQHYSDPFVDLTYARYTPLSLRLDRWYAGRFTRAADMITVTSAETRDEMFAPYGPATEREMKAKCVVIPHTYDPELFRLAAARYPRMAAYGALDPHALHLAYVGHFYGARSLAPVYRLVEFVRRHGGSIDGRSLRLHIFGTVPKRDAALIRSSYADYIQLHAPVGYIESLAVMLGSDALLVVDAKSAGVSVHFPSKLADYLGAGRPVIAFTPERGATARIVAETGHLAVGTEPSEEDLARVTGFLSSAAGGERTFPPPPAYAAGMGHYEAIVARFDQGSTG